MTNIREQYFKIRKTKWIKLFVFAQLLDLISTLFGIYFLGFKEVSPIMNRLSLLEMSVVKIILVMFMTAILYYVENIPVWAYKLLFWLSVIFPSLNIFQIVLALLI